MALYVLHNIVYASCALIAGWLADHFRKTFVLATGYALAAVMALVIILTPMSLWMLRIVFILGGIYVAVEETLEDSLCAELVAKERHGMAFGVLATVNGVGDLLSSVIVGALWSRVGIAAAFGYSAILFCVGAWRVSQLTSRRPSDP